MLEKESISIKRFGKYILIVIWIFAGVQLMEPLFDRYAPPDYAGPIVRVIANSNLKQDIEFKEKVVEELQQNELQLKQLPTAYQEQQIKVQEKQAIIPPKWVDGRFYPQMSTTATVVEIGQARGDNWFCGFFYRACGYDTRNEWKSGTKKLKSRKK